ncbi:peptide chain release factor 1 [Bifidobacterium animalis]|uniref:peptide chain release factor 1 n=1 Tax=Bifidobacterium animalis TaxID=28025 RepID=UPI00080C7F18|nr:peptide chain release factor 1 [Bifidobacterium animalis]ANU43779.1 peptide chain release factor 1 [Bifidobacterium animalis subsp. animalis]PHQ54879.1 peptide chain release factor 1 [Bifidobacterium animalis subsp. animalis]QQQ90426.1 peptide chain release factor 1 [Bifidobacterium animalis]UQE63524.1 peptide chain release factor 1 [Bifidobacterium animalis]
MASEEFPAAKTALEEYENIERQMGEQEVWSNPDKMRKLGRRQAQLGTIVNAYRTWLNIRNDLDAAQEMAGEDPDFAQEAKRLEFELPEVEEKLRTALIPRDPDDARDVIMEIKAGAGGEEAALFAGDLLRMYMRYAEKRGWSVTIQSENSTELGGVKDVQMAIRAKGNPSPEEGVWASLKYEGGVHRVQRIPVTESQGRIQTSAAGVIVFPEADEDDDEIEIDPKDLKIDIFMSSGPGGQSVNTTYSAVRMTHIPTGIVVSMQDEKSQIQNRASALRVLKSRLLAMKHEQEAAEAADMRHSQVRSLDRSERIRTYNFPENRIVDHRTNYKAYNLDAVLDGDLQAVIDSDIQADEEQRLASQQQQQ